MTRVKRLRKAAPLLAAVGISGLAVSLLYAQPPAPRRAGAAAPTAGKDRYVDYVGLRMNRRQTNGGWVTSLSTGVKFTFEDTILRTDMAAFNEKTQVATSPGRVQIDDAQNTIVGNKGVAYYGKARAVLTGNVRVLARPRPQNANAPEGSLRREFRDPVAITCDRVEYRWRRRVAVATGNLTFRQRDRTLTAEKAVYDGRAETVLLTGKVRGFDRSDEIRSPSALIGLREGEEFLELTGGVQGKIRVDDEELEDEPAATPAAPVSPAPVTPSPTTPAPQTAPPPQVPRTEGRP